MEGSVNQSASNSLNIPIMHIPHSNKPMNEYTDSRLLPASFPVLFPYGVGGHLDNNRLQQISLKAYFAHLLRLGDNRFRQHRSFIFVAFNIIQRREVSSAAYVESKKSTFERSSYLFSTLTSEIMKEAVRQEANNQTITNPAVVELLSKVHAVGAKVMASKQVRFRMRTEIRSIIVCNGAPSLFITINPADLHSPIVMMYAGKEFNSSQLDTMPLDEIPSATERARLAHLDPSAVAKYFDVVIRAIIGTIIGYKSKNGGVFGRVRTYYGVVEYQDRGTPHCHMLVWLEGALNPIALRERMQENEQFCQDLLQFVSGIIKEDVSYLVKNGETLSDADLLAEYVRTKTILEKRKHPSLYSIPDPRVPGFKEKFDKDLLAIVKRTLIHRCTNTCKKYNRGMKHTCRFDYPRELVDPPGIVYPEFGIIHLQRTNANINNHNPYLTVASRCNNDVKFISAVKMALAYIWYLTKYVTKGERSVNSHFLICAATVEKFLEKKHDDKSDNLVRQSRQLISMCLNKIGGQSELTGPQVSAHLLGIPEKYTPVQFASIHLDSIASYLEKAKIEVMRHNIPEYERLFQQEYEGENGIEEELPPTEIDNSDDEEDEQERYLISASESHVAAVNLRVDYQFRGPALYGMCLYDYAATVQKKPITSKERLHLNNQATGKRTGRVNRFIFTGGEICNEACDHTKAHPQHATHLQIHRLSGVERLVIFQGKEVPRKDDVKQQERYSLLILMLFKPWNTVHDLLDEFETWSAAYTALLDGLSPRLTTIITNIELLHRCSDESTLDQELRKKAQVDPEWEKVQRIERSVPGLDNEIEDINLENDNTEEAQHSRHTLFNPIKIIQSGLRDKMSVEASMLPLRLRGRFEVHSIISIGETDEEHMNLDIDEQQEYELECERGCVRLSNQDDGGILKAWKKTIDKRKHFSQGYNNEEIDEANGTLNVYIKTTEISSEQSKLQLIATHIHIVDPFHKLAKGLNDEQYRCFALVVDHIKRNVPESQNKPAQLLLYLAGAGGTGKSRVIQAITKYFEYTQQRESLLLIAPTGVAAANIGGTTIHAACGMRVNDRDDAILGKDAKARLQKRWEPIRYIIIDEVSMIGQKLLAQFHTCVQLAKSSQNDTIPFAGINIMFAGDFMQLPPVGDLPLYAPGKITQIEDMGTKNVTSPQSRKRKRNVQPGSIGSSASKGISGKQLWLSVKHVIQLTKQMRQISDARYAELLTSMRNGQISDQHRDMIQQRIITGNEITSEDWREAVFLVSRNDLRIQLNFEGAIEHATKHHQPVYICLSHDTYKKQQVPHLWKECFWSVSDIGTNCLSGILPLSIGMPVTLRDNICINDGMVNGALGILREVVFDEDSVDKGCSQQGTVILKRPPKYIVVELIDQNPGEYTRLGANQVPIYPTQKQCEWMVKTSDGTVCTRQFQRTQLPISPAFAFTDFKCQGTTLQKAVVDLAGGVSNTGVYVMLSRVQSLDNLLILQHFPRKVLDMYISPNLKKELNRLEELAKTTQALTEWPSVEE